MKLDDAITKNHLEPRSPLASWRAWSSLSTQLKAIPRPTTCFSNPTWINAGVWSVRRRPAEEGVDGGGAETCRRIQADSGTRPRRHSEQSSTRGGHQEGRLVFREAGRSPRRR